ncbi:hypothetical protein K5V21_06280 [Clostridium sardiniense]|uniref:Zinc ribbon domain-containing protein n=1 Tax=Clostridium sardiniense TaxID=29369 RepID=A0ABS7KWF8_CLOSR|nr:hypothetical protein [Clostridium sardiniense]MBY0755059.1 hypothetical protein [Clostridium sardiniense]MDQ0459083.1 hypothetical protein [Clostridium sardiniense]
MCKLEQCPRCKNEKLEEGQNYCQICGLDLKRTAQEVPVQEQLLNLLDGMPLYKWEQLKICIDREFKSQANKTAFQKSNTFKKTLDLEFNH